jgi:hypothetical protein
MPSLSVHRRVDGADDLAGRVLAVDTGDGLDDAIDSTASFRSRADEVAVHADPVSSRGTWLTSILPTDRDVVLATGKPPCTRRSPSRRSCRSTCPTAAPASTPGGIWRSRALDSSRAAGLGSAGERFIGLSYAPDIRRGVGELAELLGHAQAGHRGAVDMVLPVNGRGGRVLVPPGLVDRPDDGTTGLFGASPGCWRRATSGSASTRSCRCRGHARASRQTPSAPGP